jgi:hypothetical protein
MQSAFSKMASCVTFRAGPVSSSFVNKYGCRAVTIAGAVLAFVSFVLSVFAQNVITLYFTIGIGAGKYTG